MNFERENSENNKKMELTRIGYHFFEFQTIEEYWEKIKKIHNATEEEALAYWQANPWHNIINLEVTTYLREDGILKNHTFILYLNGVGEFPVFSTEKLLSICKELNYPEEKIPEYLKNPKEFSFQKAFQLWQEDGDFPDYLPEYFKSKFSGLALHHLFLGMTYPRFGEFECAAQHLRKALEKDSSLYEIKYIGVYKRYCQELYKSDLCELIESEKFVVLIRKWEELISEMSIPALKN